MPDGQRSQSAAGRLTGRARVVRDPSDVPLEPGDILVAPATDLGWTPLFVTTGDLVTETGAVMAHGPTVAREYGVPAVICAPAATTHIRDGRLITVDGAAGTVTLGSRPTSGRPPEKPMVGHSLWISVSTGLAPRGKHSRSIYCS
ncbi:PEP-utilizing enzyme [Streptomyces sp. NPDC005951]|uniref:PEP-utilizing enzyme n=1 Tax=Streptomyces sp. NPDC005951 TaxID=3154573 RepID=UPI0033E9828D